MTALAAAAPWYPCRTATAGAAAGAPRRPAPAEQTPACDRPCPAAPGIIQAARCRCACCRPVAGCGLDRAALGQRASVCGSPARQHVLQPWHPLLCLGGRQQRGATQGGRGSAAGCAGTRLARRPVRRAGDRPAARLLRRGEPQGCAHARPAACHEAVERRAWAVEAGPVPCPGA